MRRKRRWIRTASNLERRREEIRCQQHACSTVQEWRIRYNDTQTHSTCWYCNYSSCTSSFLLVQECTWIQLLKLDNSLLKCMHVHLSMKTTVCLRYVRATRTSFSFSSSWLGVVLSCTRALIMFSVHYDLTVIESNFPRENSSTTAVPSQEL